MPVRRHEPIYVPSTRSSKYGTHHDYGIDDSINRADYLSNAVLYDTYEAAKSSRGKDHALLRNVNAAIRSPSGSRDSTPVRTGRPTKRYQPVPQLDIKPPSSSRAVVPYKNIDKLRSALSTAPSPSSLLSSRINSYLRGSSVTPQSARDNILYKTFLPTSSSPSDSLQFSYRPYLSDTSPSSTFTSRLIHGYAPPSLTSSYRSSSPILSKARNYDSNAVDTDDDDYEPETSYRRKYKIIRSPIGSQDVHSLRYRSSASPEGDDVEDDYGDSYDRYGTYSCPRPSGESSHKLSTYDGDYDGSYDADMAEMYDYVPFGPSRQGILELTRHEDNNSPSYNLSSSTLRSLSPPPTSFATRSTLPAYSKYQDELLARPYQSNTLLDSILSSTAARAKKVLEDSKLPDYKHASLVLSVEGSAVSEDGKNRYGFRYYPPPIPLKGSHIGIDERILGITPKTISPADSFLSSYLNKLQDIRSDVRDHVNRGDYARLRSVVPATRPSYAHSTVHMPVHIGGRAHSVPVSSYRSRLDNGQSHRVDVFPLVVSETTMPLDKKVHLPYYKAGGDGSGSPGKLTVLEKINIKVSTEQHVNPRVAAVSRRVRASSVPPSPRPYPGLQVQQQQYTQAEAPWYLRARGGSLPPPDSRSVRATSVPPRPRRAQQATKPPEPLPTENLRAHRPVRSDFLRTIRARSLEPSDRSDYRADLIYQSSIPSTQLWAHRPVVLRRDAGRLAKAKTTERQSYPGSYWKPVGVSHSFDRASDYYITIPDVQQRTVTRSVYTQRGPDAKPPRPSFGSYSKGGIYYRTPSTSALQASRAPLPKPTDRKAIRDVDGFTKPRNLLSWQYRVESRVSPDYLIYEPSRFIRMREQVKDIQEKMDKQRQLLDRYLDSDFKITSNSSTKTEGNSASEEYNKPVSEVRRRLRKTIAMGKNNPEYFRE